MAITSAIKKYGESAFAIELVRRCTSQEDMDHWEVHFATTLNTFAPHGYNLRAGQARGVTSELTKKRISAANKGKKATDETRRKLSIAHLGHRPSEDVLNRARIYYKGRSVNELGPLATARSISRNWIVISPAGEVFQITNLAAFCREHSLSRPGMCRAASGKTYKGWKVTEVPTARLAREAGNS
jgi:hypothetical protein